ncbi:MAG: plastocyanin [Nitrosopumilus sp.]|uniref:cupredoxin domain-containing protein n=1 Tax=Nitrosopumilus sp. TaxID=2024843 RepID=UPI00247C641E|nr:plastocyanin [Nitrosopumilus sp.]MCV0391985.1 plastocyanin [Nitrosopumilus sp.]
MKTNKTIIISSILLVSIIPMWYFSSHSFTLDDEKFCEINDEGFDRVVKCVYFDSGDVLQNNKPYKPGPEQLQMVLDYCNDASEMKNAIGFEYFNDTHYINNNLCKWQKLTKFPNSDEYCIPGQNMWTDVKEIRNYTHIYNTDKCMWEQEFSWTAQYGKSDPTVMILRGAVIEGNKSLDPEVITVVLGKNNTVTWVNRDDVAHGLSSDYENNMWWTGVMEPDKSASVTFNNTGIFSYHGTPGPWISGTVVVLPENYNESNLPSSDDYDFERIHMINACTFHSLCFGVFENGTQTMTQCDFLMHGCGPVSFDGYVEEENES